MSQSPYDFGFGIDWTDACVYRREGYSTSVTDYHKHDFFEINLILSGNVKVLLADRAEELCESCVILTGPHTPHYIACRPDRLYSRLYLLFTEEFLADTLPEWKQLTSVFGKSGTILLPTAKELDSIRLLIEWIEVCEKPLEKRLLICYLLSRLGRLSAHDSENRKSAPTYVINALAYLEKHFHEHIVAGELARYLHVGRTALMTEFKRHTDSTVGEYLTNCRLRHAIIHLCDGKTVEETAALCGFSDSGGLIRAFRRCYGTTPKQYLLEKRGH